MRCSAGVAAATQRTQCTEPQSSRGNFCQLDAKHLLTSGARAKAASALCCCFPLWSAKVALLSHRGISHLCCQHLNTASPSLGPRLEPLGPQAKRWSPDPGGCWLSRWLARSDAGVLSLRLGRRWQVCAHGRCACMGWGLGVARLVRRQHACWHSSPPWDGLIGSSPHRPPTDTLTTAAASRMHVNHMLGLCIGQAMAGLLHALWCDSLAWACSPRRS